MANSPTDDELDLVETEHLFDALSRRFDVVVLATTKNRGDETASDQVHWGGGLTNAPGLVRLADMVILESRAKSLRDGA